MPKKLFDDKQEKEICRLYEKEKLPTTRIAERMVCSWQTVRRVLKRNNISLRSKGESHWKITDERTLREIFNLYTIQKIPIPKLSVRFNVNSTTIRRIIRSLGGTVRNNFERVFTKKQSSLILKMWDDGWPIKTIAKKIYPRPGDDTIQKFLKRNGQKAEARTLQRERSHKWKGGRVQNSGGYIKYKVPTDHWLLQYAKKDGYMLEHQFVVANHRGTPPRKGESIHHKNGDRTDNRLENLQLFDSNHIAGQSYQCDSCGSQFISHVPLQHNTVQQLSLF